MRFESRAGAGGSDLVASLHVTLEAALAILDSPKTLPDASPPPVGTLIAPDGTPYRYELPRFPIVATGRDESLVAWGRRYLEYGNMPAEEMQIFIEAVDGRRQCNVARLCTVPQHDSHPHWHWPDEQVQGSSGPRYPLSHPPDTLDLQTLLTEVFLPDLHVEWQTGLQL